MAAAHRTLIGQCSGWTDTNALLEAWQGFVYYVIPRFWSNLVTSQEYSCRASFILATKLETSRANWLERLIEIKPGYVVEIKHGCDKMVKDK